MIWEQLLNKPFSSSAEVFIWLSKFINLERGQTPRSFRLDRMEFLAKVAGNPEKCAPCIHIAGSKGKGSVTGIISSILEAAGFRPARYMSPHVSDFRERISLGNSFFEESVYCEAGNELRAISESAALAKCGLFNSANKDGEAPTFFELLTLYFFLCARRAECDALVLETGLGGRLDSTNIANPLVSVITLIELEHTAFLGKTISAVAGEKAGIIKHGKPVVLAEQKYSEALEVFRRKAAESSSPFLYVPELTEIHDMKVHLHGTAFTFLYRTGERQISNLSIPVPGAKSAENTALAIVALQCAFPQVGDDAIRRGLECARLPARFELAAKDPPLIIDGAHTPESAAACVETFCTLYGSDGVLLFGCAADKNAKAMAEILAARFSFIFVTSPGNFRASDPQQTYNAFCAAVCAASGQSGKIAEITLVSETAAAVMRSLTLSRSKQIPLLCAGSFYLAAEVKKTLNEII